MKQDGMERNEDKTGRERIEMSMKQDGMERNEYETGRNGEK